MGTIECLRIAYISKVIIYFWPTEKVVCAKTKLPVRTVYQIVDIILHGLSRNTFHIVMSFEEHTVFGLGINCAFSLSQMWGHSSSISMHYVFQNRCLIQYSVHACHAAAPSEDAFFDPRMGDRGAKKLTRRARATFEFVEEGELQRRADHFKCV